MEMYSVTIIVVIAVMGGVIAYIGDKLGTKVGKKRLSVFGLRPKHTSILVTIITGLLIAASTLGILTAVSRDVRTALFGMDELKTQLLSLNSEVETSRAALEAKNVEYLSLNAKVSETAAKLGQITQELETVTAERDKTAAALEELQSNYWVAQQDLAKYQNDVRQLEITKRELDAKISELSTAKNSLQSDVDRLNELTANLRQGLQVVREGTVVFRAGEVIATFVLNGKQSKEEIVQSLSTALYKTNQSLLERLQITDKNMEILWVAQKEFDQAVSRIDKSDEDIIVRVSTADNTIYGEPIIGRIELFPNRLVYNKGALVFSEVVNATDNSRQAEEIVLLFLHKVNVAAVSQGMLADPIQGNVGSIGGAQLFDIVNKVKRQKGKIEMVAVVKDDTYTVGPLEVEVRIRGVQ
ncbi:MAG TPA: DUF3084 domain-containing protein [Methylomusa anaerophila]|uniref:Chromosome partition protein Smc n=1 Tax=Methylomusa anaerophila TaxID=1930071 RepID=A0A348AKI4_9FIRM|nr:DUF3084 domain-containing protein [Methylomusa anaerophila]BBB91582.1 chromosome partition protein Smc [Methylomusa anaerophila]HML89480.1 DUF3084 domain-containing protein [Methylomusa anaerophila]